LTRPASCAVCMRRSVRTATSDGVAMNGGQDDRLAESSSHAPSGVRNVPRRPARSSPRPPNRPLPNLLGRCR
jgi:hypothetical protein